MLICHGCIHPLPLIPVFILPYFLFNSPFLKRCMVRLSFGFGSYFAVQLHSSGKKGSLKGGGRKGEGMSMAIWNILSIYSETETKG